jgi:hypothetical protein
MNKKLGFIAATAIALPILAPAAAMADDGTGAPPVSGPTTTESVYSLSSNEAIWSQGGSDVGRGAADLVMSAVVGVPELVLDAPSILTQEPEPTDFLPVPGN